jgi:crossover junction endodeoxyribonuclease RuvC
MTAQTWGRDVQVDLLAEAHPMAGITTPAGVAASRPPTTSRSGGQDAAAAGEGKAPAAAAPLVVGLDLSLTATGLCHMRGDRAVTDTISPPPNRRSGLLRLRWMRTELLTLIGYPTLVVVEGPSYSSFGQGSHDRAGLYWLVLDGLWKRGIPVAVAPPANVKKYAVGAGGGKNASKDAVLLAAARRYPTFTGDNNAADALWLAAIGTDHLTGRSVVPAAHRTALDKVAWPTVARPA